MLTEHEKDSIRQLYKTLGQNLADFRPRLSQREMIATIANTLSQPHSAEATDWQGENIAVIEGPTGVGKSLAYLLAGAVMALSRNKKLIISSATVALQEQLINRDLPFMIENCGLHLTFTLAKGRGRYVCPHRLYGLAGTQTQQEMDFDKDVLWDVRPSEQDIATLKQLAMQFDHRKWDGDRDTLSVPIQDTLWFKTTNDRHGCLKNACRHRQECPFYLARDVLESSDVIVANHDLVLADLSMGGGVILPAPEASYYCFDEAHHLAKKAINQFAAEHSLNFTQKWLDKLDGILSKISSFIPNQLELCNKAVANAKECHDILTEWQSLLETESALSLAEAKQEPIWLWDNDKIPERLDTPVNNLYQVSRALEQQLKTILDKLGEVKRDQEGQLNFEKALTDLSIVHGYAEQFAAVWHLFSQTPTSDQSPIAKWIVRLIDHKGDYRFAASPVSAAASLVDSLWPKVGGAILTSATLRALGEFTLLLRQTGLDKFPEVNCLALTSPFDYYNQGELYIPPIKSSPKDPEAHTADIIEWLPKLISPTEAVGTLVLFSSRKQMQEVAMGLSDGYREMVLMQGDLSKQQLLLTHQARIENQQPSIILGLDSFAEGLDLPGNLCVQVIISKLPFAMPDDPVGKTLAQWVEGQGGNAFIDISVPEASIKLIQAVGRLIRKETDTGRITILDHRVIKQRYGKKLLDALPPFKRI